VVNTTVCIQASVRMGLKARVKDRHSGRDRC